MKLSCLEATFLRHESKEEPVTIANDPMNYPAGGTRVEVREVFYSIPVATLAEADGIRFLCPKAYNENGGPERTHSVEVWFEGSPVPHTRGLSSNGAPARWRASGSGLDDLTLTPSILEVDGGFCGWHGFVTNGDAA